MFETVNSMSMPLTRGLFASREDRLLVRCLRTDKIDRARWVSADPINLTSMANLHRGNGADITPYLVNDTIISLARSITLLAR